MEDVKRETIYEDAESFDEKDNNMISIINKSNLSLSIINSSGISNSNTHNNTNITNNTIVDNNEKEQKKIDIESFRKKEQLTEDISHLLRLHNPIEYITSNLKIIKSKSSSTKRALSSLIEIQNFQCDVDTIWVIKLSYNGKYLATGGKSGVLKIWEILTMKDSIDAYERKNILKYMNYCNEDAYRIYTEHSKDIIDIAWSKKNDTYLVTVSLDHYAVLYDITQKDAIAKYNHDSIISCVDFYPNVSNFAFNRDDDIFVTGAFDRIIRIWNVKNKEEPIMYVNVAEYITALSFFPNGQFLSVGSSEGKISVYDCEKQLRYSYSFNCRNKKGKYSNGRKITDISFKSDKDNIAIISTNDSRIRIVDINDGTVIYKMKGHVNEEGMIKADINDSLVISCSEDNYIYVWSNDDKEIKNYCYEYFKPFDKDKGKVTCSIFSNREMIKEFNMKYEMITKDFHIRNIIINASTMGYLQIILNYDTTNINV